jgi:hypothetical protein
MPLHGVGEERHFVAWQMAKNFAPRLDDAGLVVRGHHGDEAGARVGQFGVSQSRSITPSCVTGMNLRACRNNASTNRHDARMFDGGNPDFGLGVQRFAKWCMTMLFASVAPLVQMMSSGWQPRNAASFSRASAAPARARAGLVHGLDGLPPMFSVAFSQASRASRITGAVAL